MNRLKSVLTAAVLTLALAVSAAGHQPSDCKPGETQTPPCPSGLVTSENPVAVFGETQTPPKAQSVEIVSLVELALSVLSLA
ncbi:MAG: hypothetical protein WAM70_00125 [Pyrinomonadaceae bacterium]